MNRRLYIVRSSSISSTCVRGIKKWKDIAWRDAALGDTREVSCCSGKINYQKKKGKKKKGRPPAFP